MLYLYQLGQQAVAISLGEPTKKRWFLFLSTIGSIGQSHGGDITLGSSQATLIYDQHYGGLRISACLAGELIVHPAPLAFT